MKLKYYYDNGKIAEHTIYISKKTILKEMENATKVYIYKISTMYGEETEKYITTLSLN